MTFITLRDDPALSAKQYGIAKKIWAPVMLHSKIADKYWGDLEKFFPEFQIFLISDAGEVIGFANLLTFHWKGNLSDLPDNGWDWLIQDRSI